MKHFNKILFFVLAILTLNLAREYFFKPVSGLEIAQVKQPVELKIHTERKSWLYYKDSFNDDEKLSEPVNISLPLALKGTVISTPDKSFAVIDDLSGGTQGLYSLGDVVCGAKIIAMNRNRVVVECDGIKHNLSVDGKNEHSGRGYRDAKNSETKLAKAQIDFNQLLAQVRIKPYFEGGQCVGFQLNSIRDDSVVKRVGLRNGDIIETVNGIKINDPLQALQIIYSLEDKNPVHLGIERQDEKMELNCRIEG